MANTPRSSFIPRQTTAAAPKKVRHKRVFSILGFLATTFLVASLLAGGGVFAYRTYVLQPELEAKATALAVESESFSEENIERIREFNQRLEVARILLDRHVAPSQIFAALEANTKQSIQYTELNYEKRPSGNITLALGGVTDEFAKVALQSLQNLSDLTLQESVVTSVGLDTGAADAQQVSFRMVTNIPLEEVRFDPSAVPPPVIEETVSDESEGESSEDDETTSSDTEVTTDTTTESSSADTGTSTPSESTIVQ